MSDAEQDHCSSLLTIQLLDGQLVVRCELEAGNVPHTALVVRLHDGWV